MTALTNTAIDALPVGQELKDDRVPGLSVRRHASGVSFMYYYRTKHGVPRRPKIGAYGMLTISQARDIARGMAAQVAGGGDPVADRDTVRNDTKTMEALWARTELEHYTGAKAWGREAKRLYTVNAKPTLGKLRVAAVTYDDISAVHRRLAKRPVEANRTLAVLSKMLSLAERWGWRASGSNPCQHVERYPEQNRRRFAQPDEIAEVGRVLESYAGVQEHVSGVAFIYLLMFTGARPSEIANGKPSQVQRLPDGRGGVLRLAEGKTGQRDVYLPPQAMAVLDKLPADRDRLAGRSALPRRLWRKVRVDAGCADLWARDWRRTFASMGLSNGIAIGQLAELLGHASTQTTKIYAKLMEDPAVAAAAAIAGRMERMLNPEREQPAAGQAETA